MKPSLISFILLTFLYILNVNAGSLFPDFSSNKKNQSNLSNIKTDIKYGGSSFGTLDIYYDKNDINNLKPVLIFIHGGAWMFSDKNQNSGIGNLLIREEYIGVIPNYVLFPRGSMDDMVDDIYKAIKWTYKNISKYGGNKNKIILSGHSAGAHLAVLTTFKLSLGIKNNGKILDPLPEFQNLVLFNGPYDFDDYDLGRIFGNTNIEHGIVERLVTLLVKNEDICPTDILKKFNDDSLETLGASKITLFAAEKDQIVPYSSANNLSKQIRRVSPSTILNFIYTKDKKFDHVTLIDGVNQNNNELEQMFMNICEM